ncbi:MAG: sulfurtransferase TusA family protein [ANME-2 cluster archaeon]|nr:sulfurtransferase TusA family protein [ANME-2 cluster archaeon]
MISETIDTRGDICPVPLLKTTKTLATLQSGDTFTVVSDHPPAKRSIPMELKKRGIDYKINEKGAEFEITINVP